ncbi:iron complex transport system substrate-binding protein [Altererythrobacter xiamenensis]|uniref:Iron complex transport system substrate-binding protein n=1 Tax=Altererythrobacter xiamenensis TaxID=1316679 RepID=A0A1Y6EC30_9SPHN|nr:ABC transporter substrate-binding protein [Altererythrobacter xiamenensis]SMQ58172.1 iron complex transport system substrate-binding protein [Altererythrobacter xiamenensis]
MTKWGSLRRATDALAAGGLALALVLGGCSAPETAADRDIQPTAKRIVSLNPCTDAMLVEMSADQILALSHYSHDPASSSIPQNVAKRYEVTGGTVEEILALDPDVVLASTFIAPATRSALEDLGIRVEAFGSPQSVAESEAQIRRLAKIVGRELEGEWLVRDIDRALENATGKPKPDIDTLLWQPGQIVPGGETLVAEVMEQNGFTSFAEKRGLNQADYVSLERLLADPPELLLVAGDSPAQTHPALQRLADTRVESFEPRLLYCGGRTIVGVQMRLDAIRREMRQAT